MATTNNTNKTTKTTKTNSGVSKTEYNKLAKENENLKKQLDDVILKMENLTSKLGQSNIVEDEINYKQDIMVISQCVGSLTLSTGGNGQGVIYEFPEFGYDIDIPYGELKDIVKRQRKSAENGLYYIADSKAVEQLRLKKYYDKIVKFEDMKNLFKKDCDTIVEIYELAPDAQKEIIIDMIIDRKLNGVPVDANVLLKIGDKAGKDLISIEQAEK